MSTGDIVTATAVGEMHASGWKYVKFGTASDALLFPIVRLKITQTLL